jgi:hypothetical protein
MLKHDGKFILNMKEKINDNNILNDMLSVCNEYGFNEVDRYYIKLSRNTNYMGRNKVKLEPIIVMQK